MTTTTPQESVVVSILGKDYHVKCPPDKAKELQDSAAYLSKKMDEILRAGNTVGLDRVAITAALNVCHELLIAQKQNQGHAPDFDRRLNDLQNKIEQALND